MSVDFCRSARYWRRINRVFGNLPGGKRVVFSYTYWWSYLGLVVLTLISFGEARTAFASEKDWIESSARVVASDLNMMTPHLLQTDLSNFQVALIAAAGCSSLRYLDGNDNIGQAVDALLEVLPDDFLQDVDNKIFFDAERDIFSQIGATNYSTEYLDRSLLRFPVLPPIVHGNVDELQIVIEGLAYEACEFRNDMIEKSLSAPVESASEEDQKLAHCIGLKVLGGVVILGNAAVGVGAINIGGPYATWLISAVSVGWGWNRLEAACV